MKTVSILSRDALYAEMLALELRAEGYNAIAGRAAMPDLTIIDLDSESAVQGVLALTFSYEKGAELCRPFDIEELKRAVAQKLSDTPALEGRVMGEFFFSPDDKTVIFKGERILLSALEYELLALLYERMNSAVSTAEISEKVFESEENPNLVRVYISYLREKIDKPFGLRRIVTARGKGYMLKGE